MRALLVGFLMVVAGNVPQKAQASGSVETVELQSQGIGATQRDAVLDGVREAVSMVNGMAMAAETSLTELTAEVTTESDSAFLMSSAFMEQISTATSGIVEGYEILSSGRGCRHGSCHGGFDGPGGALRDLGATDSCVGAQRHADRQQREGSGRRRNLPRICRTGSSTTSPRHDALR